MTNNDSQQKEKMAQLERESFFDLSPDLNCISSLKGKFLRLNQNWEKATGYGREDLEGQMILGYMHPDDRPKMEEIIGGLKKNRAGINLTSRFRCRDGDYKIFEWAIFIHDNYAYLTARVCTKYLERCEKIGQIPIEGLIAHERQVFRTVLLAIGDAIISTDKDCKIVLMNPMAEMLTGWSLEEVQGKNLGEVYHIQATGSRIACPDFVKEVIRSGQRIEIEEVSLTQKNGKTIFVQDSVAAIRDADEKIIGAVLIFRDFTEKRERLKQVEYLSFHDYLTGLYNRRYMDDAIKRLDQERNLPLSFMVMDVNGLKLVNDSFGHEMGDRLIQKVADLIRGVSRKDDIIARTGGDEFAIILANTDEEELVAIKDRFKEEMTKTSLGSVVVSVAVGWGIKTKKEDDFISIVKEADDAMYRDKVITGRQMRSQIVEVIMQTINKDYDQEAIHLEVVAHHSQGIAKALDLKEEEISQVKMAARLHDIGKIAIAPDLLGKKESLSDEEISLIKSHPETSYHILREVDEYSSLADVVLYHHERWDGTGYPKGLKGEEIPLWARIIAVADAYEVMMAGRPYQAKKTKEGALAELEKYAGSQFDPVIVMIFVGQMRQKK